MVSLNSFSFSYLGFDTGVASNEHWKCKMLTIANTARIGWGWGLEGVFFGGGGLFKKLFFFSFSNLKP